MKEIKFYNCTDTGVCLVDFGESSSPCRVAGMELMEPNTTEAATEKHLPVGRLHEGVLTVSVGETDHPMLPEHYIQWIFMQTTLGGSYRRLRPGDQPRAAFLLQGDEEVLGVYAYCNLHGLWRAEARDDSYFFHETVCSAEFTETCRE